MVTTTARKKAVLYNSWPCYQDCLHTYMVAAWLSGNAVVSTNVVALRRAWLVLGWVTVRGYTILVFNQSHPGLLSLAIPPWVGTMSTGGGLGKKRQVLRNNGPVPGLLAYWPSQLKALAAMGPAIRLTCVVC